MSSNILLVLPYPPSVNSYWGFKGSRRFLTKKAVEFKEQVAVAYKLSRKKSLGKSRITLEISLYPPDRRKTC